MHCPSCERKFTFLDSFKIINPFGHRCPRCKSKLTTGKTGGMLIGAGMVMGLFLGAIAIYFVRAGLLHSGIYLLLFILSIFIIAVLFQFLAWKICKFKLVDSQ